MKKIFLCTTNIGKVIAFNKLVKDYNVQFENIQFEIPEWRQEDNREISRDKSIFAFNIIKKPVVAIDSGLYIPSLNWFPKTFVNFMIRTIGIDWLIKLLEAKDSDCEIRNSIAYMDEDLEEPKIFTEIISGDISLTPRWDISDYNRSILHRIFTPKWYNKTLAEMTEREYIKRESKKTENGCMVNFLDWITKRDG